MKRATIPVFYKTYEKLLAQKLKMQGEKGKHITWDNFFLILIKRCS